MEATMNPEDGNSDNKEVEVDNQGTEDKAVSGEDSNIQEMDGEGDQVRRKQWSTSKELLLCNSIAESALNYGKFKAIKTPFCGKVSQPM
jgi:hypothetical protein